MASKKKDLLAQANTNRVYNAIADATADPDENTAPAEVQPATAAPAKGKTAASDPLPRRNRATPPTQEETDIARQLGRTQGRKGIKAIRINMAFSPDVHDYINTMSRARGQSITAFTDYVFRNNMEQNKELYEQAKAFVANFEKGT
ncbi:MAG: hypothetical protein IJ181_10010 [Acidaminococcaceae bacterium]|nr:hypothetical protein [Acidaminococcaceae bacterium]